MNANEPKPLPSVPVVKDPNDDTMEFVMGWYGRPIAKMKYSGVDFGFDYESGWMLPMESYKTRQPGKEPMFLRSFLPPWVENRSNDKKAGLAMSKFFQEQQLFLSNIAIVRNADQLALMGHDHLHARLKDYTSADGVFTGTQRGIEIMTRERESNMAQVSKEKRLTQISGSQTKMSMFLSPQGELVWEFGLPSTHIIKYAGFANDTARVRGAAEWAGMTLACAAGVACADFALIEMPSEGGGMRLNYLTERFDLPTSKDDERLIFCEEVGAAMGVRPGPAGAIVLNDVIEGVLEFSTNKRGDMTELFKQVVANCILENADFHARNMSLLKIASPTLDAFRSVRLSPAYDVMRTRDFRDEPGPGCREAMKLSFIDAQGDMVEFDDPTVEQFQEVGQAMGLSAEQSEKLLYRAAVGMLDKAIFLKNNQPEVFDRHEQARKHVEQTSHVVIQNVLALFPGLADKLELAELIGPKERRPAPGH